jgi:hypothetical protein
MDVSFAAVPWTHIDPPQTTLTIPPGVTRSLDLATIDLEDGTEPKLRLMLRPEPGNQRNVLPPGHYSLVLSVTARNADAHRVFVGIEWGGGRSTDPKQMETHLAFHAREETY